MTSNQLFNMRQLCHLIGKGIDTDTALNTLINNLEPADKNLWLKVQQHHQKGHDIFSSLQQLKDSEVERHIQGLRSGTELGIEEKELLNFSAKQSVSTMEIYSIIKSRLLKSVGYAALVSILALLILGIFVNYVLPVYKSVLYDMVTTKHTFMANIEALTFQSWQSLLIYLPPLIVITIFIAIYRFKTESILNNRTASYIPLVRGIKHQVAKVGFFRKVHAFHSLLSVDEKQFQKQLDSPFFTGSKDIKLSTLLDDNAQKKLLALQSMGTLNDEIPLLKTSVETSAIETISQKTNTLAIIFHIIIILIVAKIIQTLYIPIFQLGAGF